MEQAGDWIQQVVEDHIAAGKTELPLFDPVGIELQELLLEPDFDMGAVETLIRRDPTLTTALLRLANSSYYRGLEKLLDVHDAIMRLGVLEVSHLVFMISHGAAYRVREVELRGLLERLWRHAVGSAVSGRWLVGKLRRPDLGQAAFLGGLLHDVGKLFVLRVLDDVDCEERPALIAAAPELLASMHNEKGYDLLQRWNLPPVCAEIARHHHDDCVDPSDTLSLVVRLVDQVCNRVGIGLQDGGPDPVGSEEAAALGVPEKGVQALEKKAREAVELAAQG